MPRAELPKFIVQPKASHFTFENKGLEKNIAKTLGLRELPADIKDSLIEVISSYKAISGGTKSCTVANVRLALQRIVKGNGKLFGEAVQLLADDRSGVDSETHAIIKPLAKATLAGDKDAKAMLITAAHQRYLQLEKHPRIDTDNEVFRHFCGRLRIIFNHAATPEINPNHKKGWNNCKHFAKVVFIAADIKTPDFDSNPGLLKKYLGTDVTNTEKTYLKLPEFSVGSHRM